MIENPSNSTAGFSVAELPPILTPDELASTARCGRAFVYKAIKAGTLNSFKRGHRRVISGHAAKSWLEAGTPV